MIRAPKKLEVYLQVKRNYSFHIHMVRLMVSEMVKWREAEERKMTMLEQLMKWVEETEMEMDGEESEELEVREGKE